MSIIKQKNAPQKGTISLTTPKREPLPRTWFLSRGYKKVPPELIDGKVLWAHPDGYFVNAYGQKVLHNFSPTNRTPGRYCHNGKRGNAYPSMRNFGGKNCHVLMAFTFHGARPDGYQCDHINGVVTDYSAANLEWVTPAENRRRAKYLRFMRECDFDPRIFTTPDFHYWFSMPFEDFKKFFQHYQND